MSSTPVSWIKRPVIQQAYVFEEHADRTKPAKYNGEVEFVRAWVLENTKPSNHHKYVVYMDETMTYMSIPQFLELTKTRAKPTKIQHLQNSIDFAELAETVNHPSHYNTGKIEVIDAIEDWGLGFNDGNVVKYVARAKHKNNQIEDLKKAAWYLNREIERLQK